MKRHFHVLLMVPGIAIGIASAFDAPSGTLWALTALALTTILAYLGHIEHRLTSADERATMSHLVAVRVQQLPQAIVRPVFEKYVHRWLFRLDDALSERRLSVHPVDEFPDMYCDTLERAETSHLMATSLATNRYFWRNEHVLSAIERHIERGGSMERLFFIDGETPTGDELEVMRRHAVAGVTVRYLSTSSVEPGRALLFVAFKDRDIAWEARQSGGVLCSATVTANPREVAVLRERYRELVRTAGVRSFELAPGA